MERTACLPFSSCLIRAMRGARLGLHFLAGASAIALVNLTDHKNVGFSSSRAERSKGSTYLASGLTLRHDERHLRQPGSRYA